MNARGSFSASSLSTTFLCIVVRVRSPEVVRKPAGVVKRYTLKSNRKGNCEFHFVFRIMILNHFRRQLLDPQLILQVSLVLTALP